MSVIYVDRESHTTDSRLVVPTVQLRDDRQVIAGANQPLIVRDGTIQDVIDGRTFYVGKVYLTSAPLAAGGTIDFVITSSPGINVGIGFQAGCGGNADVSVYEGVTDIVGGTVVVPFNRNRGSSRTSTTGVLLDPTSLTLGTLIYQQLIFGGTGGNAAGATATGDYALLDDVSYLFRLTNETNKDNIAQLAIVWTE
jgi:hypothetical protein